MDRDAKEQVEGHVRPSRRWATCLSGSRWSTQVACEYRMSRSSHSARMALDTSSDIGIGFGIVVSRVMVQDLPDPPAGQ